MATRWAYLLPALAAASASLINALNSLRINLGIIQSPPHRSNTLSNKQFQHTDFGGLLPAGKMHASRHELYQKLHIKFIEQGLTMVVADQTTDCSAMP